MKNKIIQVVSILFGLMLANSGLNKFFHYMPMPEMSEGSAALMGAFGASGWLFPLIAIAEIVGGILVIIPKFRALGSIILFPVIVGIFLLHAVQDPGTVAIAIVLLAINLWFIFENRAKYMPMIS